MTRDPTLTLAQVRQRLRIAGYTCTREQWGDEYRVRRIGSAPGEGYFTNDLQDALDTGLAMIRQDLSAGRI